MISLRIYSVTSLAYSSYRSPSQSIHLNSIKPLTRYRMGLSLLNSIVWQFGDLLDQVGIIQGRTVLLPVL